MNLETTKPLVTVITPLYNCSQHVEEAVLSVINQTYDNWEMIIVDDFSTDASYETVKRVAAGDKRISLCRLDENRGSAAARNHALKRARGKYVTFLDSDDTLDDTYIEEQIGFIAEHGPIVSAGYRRKTSVATSDFFVPEKVDYDMILKGNPLSCLSTMYDREVFPDHFFAEDMKRHEDYLFWIGMLKKGFTAYGNPRILATYRISKDSKNSNKLDLVKPMYVMYHEKLKICWLKSWFYVLRYALYSKKKYRNVK